MKTRSILKAVLSSVVLVVSAASPAGAQPEPRFRGEGDHLTEPIELEDGLLVVAAGHLGDANFVVQVLDGDGNLVGIPVNAIGRYNGARVLPVKKGRHLLQITASGPWIINADNPNPNQPPDALPTSHEASGDLVLGPIRMTSGLARVALTHDGAANFAVMLYGIGGDLVGLLANAIGAYDGSTGQRIPADGLYFVDVMADGNWTFSMQ